MTTMMSTGCRTRVGSALSCAHAAAPAAPAVGIGIGMIPLLPPQFPEGQADVPATLGCPADAPPCPSEPPTEGLSSPRVGAAGEQARPKSASVAPRRAFEKIEVRLTRIIRYTPPLVPRPAQECGRHSIIAQPQTGVSCPATSALNVPFTRREELCTEAVRVSRPLTNQTRRDCIGQLVQSRAE
jgi:hypothetical protein